MKGPDEDRIRHPGRENYTERQGNHKVQPGREYDREDPRKRIAREAYLVKSKAEEPQLSIEKARAYKRGLRFAVALLATGAAGGAYVGYRTIKYANAPDILDIFSGICATTLLGIGGLGLRKARQFKRRHVSLDEALEEQRN